MRLVPVALCSAALALGACGGDGKPAATPSAAAAHRSAGPLLEPDDLPDGYETSPPDATPEVSTASSPSVPGCDALLDYFRGGTPTGGGQAARFEAGGTGPFLAESIGTGLGTGLADLAARCASFTDTNDGETTTVSVTAVGDFPKLGEDEHVFAMTAGGGTAEDTFELSGYLLTVRVDGLTCTIVHFGQPGVNRAETETIAKAAVGKIKRRE
ncbi:hypothetical protein [Dactylosporangium sp. CA-233914]|uniref:hypothetical protein n=1 Tax=Dactylosporangium sp. CA-233914 TaxID=3239934 RepID=UPI003D8A02F5